MSSFLELLFTQARTQSSSTVGGNDYPPPWWLFEPGTTKVVNQDADR